MNGKTIALDGLEIQVEEDGESSGPESAFKYRVTITADDGYVYETRFVHRPDRPLSDGHGNRDPNSKRDYEGVAWVVLDQLSSAVHEGNWYFFDRDYRAAAKRLAPLLKRNAATIIEGSEQVDWW